MQTMTAPWFSTQEAANAAGCSYRQVDYWIRSGAIAPHEWRGRGGSGSQRRWAPDQIRLLRVIRHLTAIGATVESAGRAAAELALLPVEFWSGSHIVDGLYLLNLASFVAED